MYGGEYWVTQLGAWVAGTLVQVLFLLTLRGVLKAVAKAGYDGYEGGTITSEEQLQQALAAREAALAFIGDRLAQRAAVSGADVDRVARESLTASGFGSGIRHRTGHSIGTRIHGYGVNLDSVEFPDERPLGEGACFSVEPGIYLDDLGMRTEIDACITGGRLVIAGGERQTSLLRME